jgi:hypothetical protein
MAQNGIIGKNTLDESLYSQDKAYHRSTRGDETSKFRVNSIVNRDKLITDDRIDIGHIIYFDNGTEGFFPRGHYQLEEYPTYGSLTGVKWKPLASEEVIVRLSYFVPDNRKTSDATYLDVTLSGNILSLPSVPFTADDVGKTIAIKKAHQNPDTADGTELPDTQLGRLVTATVTIQSVDVGNQTAVISETLNQSGQLRAFLFYNYLDNYVEAVNTCYDSEISKLEIDISGIVGLSLFGASHSNRYILIKSATGDLNVYPKKGLQTVFKWVNENVNYRDAMYRIEAGNGDFYHSINTLPPDEGSTVFGYGWNFLEDTEDAGHHQSVRTLQIENIKFTDQDLDGNDGRWSAIAELSGGGNDELFEVSKVQYQNITIKNCTPRCKNDGITIFNNINKDTNFPGNNNIYIEDVDLRYWSSNYHGEHGRSWVDNDTIENCNNDNVVYKFGINPNDPDTTLLTPASFTVLNGILTVNDPDFSWYDYRLFMELGLGRTWKLSLINDLNEKKETLVPHSNTTLSYIVDAKSIDTSGFGTPLPDGSYKALDIRPNGTQYAGYYGHPTYIHPHQNITAVNLKSDKDICWWNSSGYKKNDLKNKWIKLYQCEINVLSITNGGATDVNVYLDSCRFDTSTLFFANELHCHNTEVPEIDGVNEIYVQGEVNFKGSIICYNDKQTEFHWNNVTLGGHIKFYVNPVTFHVSDFKFSKGFVEVFTQDGSKIIYERMRRDSKLPKAFGNFNIDPPHELNQNSKVIWKDCMPDVEGLWNSNGVVPNNDTLKGNIEFINSTLPVGTYDGLNDAIAEVQMPVNANSGTIYDTDFWGHGSGTQLGMYQGFGYLTADFAKSDTFNVLLENHSVFRPKSAKEYSSWNFRDGGYDALSWWKGEVFFKVTTDNPFDTLQSWVGRNNMYSNIRLKGLKREIGEVIRFSIDHENGILFEEDSTHSVKKVSALPNDGIGGEFIDFNGVQYKYNVELNEVVDELSTITLSNEDFQKGTITYDGIGFSTNEFYTMGQDLYERGYRDFKFSLILDDDTELIFVPRKDADRVNGVHDRHFWLFQTTLPNVTANSKFLYAYVDCKTGDFRFIIVKDDGISPVDTRIDNWGYTLKSTNNFKLTATKVVSKAWEEHTLLMANPNGDPLLFFNELGDAVAVSSVEPNTVFIDGVHGDDSTGQLTNRANPFKTFAAANAAVIATSPSVLEGWTYEYLGDNITYNLDKAPKCNIKHYATGYNVIFDFSNATNDIYEHGGATRINFIIDNKYGGLIFNKSFSGDGGNGGSSQFHLLNISIDVSWVNGSSIDDRSLFACSGYLNVNVLGQVTMSSGYFLHNADLPDHGSCNVYINRFVGAGISQSSGIIRYAYNGDVKVNYMKDTAMSYRMAGANFVVGDMYDSSFSALTSVEDVIRPTVVTFANSYIYNCRLFPRCFDSFVLTGIIRDLVVVDGGVIPHSNDIEEGLRFDDLIIFKVRWSDNSLTRGGVLIDNGYGGVKLQIAGLRVLDCQMSFASIISLRQVDWDNNVDTPMNWFGSINVNCLAPFPAFRTRNVSNIPDKYAKVNLFGSITIDLLDDISYPGVGNDYTRNIELTKMKQY